MDDGESSSHTLEAGTGESAAEGGGAGFGRLPGWTAREMPAFPGMLRALGPGIVWMALAQGSGELVWWPYIVAKYGLGFVFLLIPACLLQVPVNYEIGRYTLLTGESIWQGFIRLNRWLSLGMWVLMTISTAFLSDTWMTTIDAVSRVHTDVVYAYVPGARRLSQRGWYWVFVLAAGGITVVTLPLTQYDPGKMILSASVVGFAGTVTFTISLLVLNHVVMPRKVAPEYRPGRWSWVGIGIAAAAYCCLAAAYAYVSWR